MSRATSIAMATQLDRVNRRQPEQRAVDLEMANARLTHRLELARERITQLEAEVAGLRATLSDQAAAFLPSPSRAARFQRPLLDDERPTTTLMYAGRPATTVARIAQHYAVHPSTVTRHLQSGKIAGEQLPGSNRWIVYLDRKIGPFRR
ncbi:MAG: hypothetical protein WCZ87_00205 [Thiohalobacteraceae bacterium]